MVAALLNKRVAIDAEIAALQARFAGRGGGPRAIGVAPARKSLNRTAAQRRAQRLRMKTYRKGQARREEGPSCGRERGRPPRSPSQGQGYCNESHVSRCRTIPSY